MHELRKKRGKPILVAEDCRYLKLVDPIGSFRCLKEDLQALPKLERIELNAGHDETHSLDFIGGLNSLQELSFDNMPALSDWSGMLGCPLLRKLVIGWNTKFDFRLVAQIKSLRSFLYVMCDENQIARLTEAAQLEEVVLRGGFKLDSLQLFSRMPRIEVLQLWSGKIRSTVGLGSLLKLRDLNLGYSHVQEVAEIRELPALTRLQLLGNKAIREMDSLACPSLERLEMFEIPRIASLQPLKRCQLLKEFLFAGEVADGDLSPLFDLPALEKGALGPRYKKLLTNARPRMDCKFQVGNFFIHLSPDGLKSVSKWKVPGAN